MMEFTLRQIIMALLILLFIFVVVLFGPGMIKSISDKFLEWGINLNLVEKPEYRVAAENKFDELITDLQSCIPDELKEGPCFCKTNFDLPSDYVLRIEKVSNGINLILMRDKLRISEGIVPDVSLGICTSTCILTDNVDMDYTYDVIKQGDEKNEFDKTKLFYYAYSDRPTLFILSKDYAEYAMRQGIGYCGEGGVSVATDDGKDYGIMYIYSRVYEGKNYIGYGGVFR
jgi:hypothetical protein